MNLLEKMYHACESRSTFAVYMMAVAEAVYINS